MIFIEKSLFYICESASFIFIYEKWKVRDMVDYFKTMTELLTYTNEDKDWEIQTCERDSPVLITAVHGGAIERGTTEVAQHLSETGNYSFYSFKGVRKIKQ